MSDLARLTVDLAAWLGCERVISLGAGAPERLVEIGGRMPLVVLSPDGAGIAAPGPVAQLRWSPDEPLPGEVRSQLASSLVVCDSLLGELDDPGPLLATLRELLDDAPAALVTAVDRDLVDPATNGVAAPWSAEELLRTLARAGLETVWAGITDAHGTLGRRAGLTCAASRNRPGDVRAALAAGPLGLGFDPGADRRSPRKARVCIAAYELVGPTRTGGIGTAYTSLAEALADAEHEVTVLFTGWEEIGAEPFAHWARHYRARGIDLQRLPPADPRWIETGHRHAVRSYEAYRRLRELERERPFDVIHFPEVLGHGYYTLCARRLGIAFSESTIVVGTHSSTSWVLEANGTVFQAIDDFADDFIERRSVEMCDVLISPSAYMLDWVRSRGWALPERHFVQQYVRSRAAAPAGTDAGDAEAEHGHTELVFFGRLEPRKGLRVFCDALDLLAAERPDLDCQVTFLGKRSSIDGIDAGEYLDRRRAAWPWEAHVIDYLGQPEAIAHLRAPGRRLTVIPSLADNSPNTVYEALALRIPFIASRVGGTAELIDPRDVARATFDPEADRPTRTAHGTAALAERIATALDGTLHAPRPAVDPDACREAHVRWHATVSPPPAVERRPPPAIAVCAPGADPDAVEGDAILFLPRGARLPEAGLEVLGRAAALTAAELIAIPVAQGTDRHAVTRVPVGGPPLAGLFRRCLGDSAFLVRRETLSSLGGLDPAVPEPDRAHHLLCRAALAGVPIEIAPEPVAEYPSGLLPPLSIVEQSRRRQPILDLYAEAPPAVAAGLPLLAQQLYALGIERQHQFEDLYANRFGRLTIPIRRWRARARRARGTLGRERP